MSTAKGGRHDHTLKTRLPVSQRAAYGVGHVLNDLIASVWFSYIIIYLTKVVQLSNRYTGLVILLGQIVDGVFSPIIGIISDKTVCRYGRRKVWHLIGSLLDTITIPLLLVHILKDDTAEILKLVYFVSVAAFFQFGWGCVQISQLSLIPEISRRKNERVELNALRSAVTFLCGIYIYGATWILLGQSTETKITPKVWKEFMYLAFIIIITGNVFNIAFHVVIKEPASQGNSERLAKKQQKHLNGSLDNASVLPAPAIVHTKDDIGFTNHALSTSTNPTQHLHEETNTYSHCNGNTQDGVTNTSQVTTDVTKDTESDFVTLDITTDVTKVTECYSNPCNCSSATDDIATSASDCLTIIDRKSQHALPTCKKEWLKNMNLYKTAVVYMCTRLVVNVSQTYLPLYLTETLLFEKEAIAYFPLVVLISGVLASFLVKALSSKVGQKITFIIGATSALAACVWFYFQTVGKRTAIYAATVLMGSGGSVMLVTSLSMIADLVGDDKKCGAFVYGSISFADKVASGVVIAIIQELNPRELQADDCAECIQYIRTVQSIAPGAAALVGLLTVILFYNSMFVCRMKAEYRDVGLQVNTDHPCNIQEIDVVEAQANVDETESVIVLHSPYQRRLTQLGIETRF